MNEQDHPCPRFQRGQAIVLIAITLAVVVGMAALAIDGSRAYALRRDLQAAVDSAALAAADKLQQNPGNYALAEAAATTVFSVNLRLYAAPTCAPAYASPGSSPLTVVCTYSDGTTLTQVASNLGPRGGRFFLTARRSLQLQFARILTNGATPTVSAVSGGGVNNLLYQPTLAAISRAGCGGASGSAITISGSGVMGLVGDMVSSGAISITGGTVQVTGDAYARCQSSIAGLSNMCYPSGSIPPCTFPDVAGATRSGYNFVDPQYPPPSVLGGPQSRPGNNVVLFPGTYAADPAFVTGKCYFLSAGVYQWSAGYTNNGAFVSNELRPPDEPRTYDNTQLARQQFWNYDGLNCEGSFQLATTGASGIRTGTWAIEITSVRSDAYNGVNYQRESAPSVCRTINIGPGQVIQLQLSNVPGATSYNIYAAPPDNGCSGPFGLAGNIAARGPVLNNDTSGCPFGNGSGNGHGNGNGNNGQNCSLNGEDVILDTSLLGPLFTPNALAPPGVIGSYPPASETDPLGKRLANQNPDRASPPDGDRANENQCDTVAGVLSVCPDQITPGAVESYIPSGGCLNNTSTGDSIIFSGYQYNWLVLYEPGNANPPANTCSNLMGAATDSALIGLIYLPAASVTVQKNASFTTDEGGGMIANKITFTSRLPNLIGDPVHYGPVPPASRLTS